MSFNLLVTPSGDRHKLCAVGIILFISQTVAPSLPKSNLYSHIKPIVAVQFNDLSVQFSRFGAVMPDTSKNTNNYLIERPQYSLSYNNETKGANWVSWQLNKAWLGDVRRQRITGEPNNPDNPYVEQVPIVSYGNSYAKNYPPGFDDGGLDSNFPQSPDQVRPVDATFSPYDNNSNPVVYPWVPDGLLPADWVRTQGGDYRDNTLYVPGRFELFADRRYEKGHLAPIEDRTRTFKDALSTYMTTNLLPFQHYVNKTPWKNFEEESNKFVQRNNAELYIIAGATGYNLDRTHPDDSYPTEHPFQNHPDPLPGVVKNLIALTEDKGESIFYRDSLGRIRTRNGGNEGINYQWLTNPKQIGIPEFFWKIVVPLRPGQGIADLNEDTQPIAVIMPNIDARKFPGNQLILENDTILDLSRPGVWETYAVTVRDVENLTGYNFFSGLTQELQDAIEERRNTNFFLNTST